MIEFKGKIIGGTCFECNGEFGGVDDVWDEYDDNVGYVIAKVFSCLDEETCLCETCFSKNQEKS